LPKSFLILDGKMFEQLDIVKLVLHTVEDVCVSFRKVSISIINGLEVLEQNPHNIIGPVRQFCVLWPNPTH
jgi:hypothetical protein